MINRFSQLRQTPDVPSRSTATNPTYVSIPYVKGTSEAIRCILALLDIKTTFRPNNTLRLVHPKDPTPLQDKAGVMYKIPCSSCPKVYIGQTGRTLGQRVKEHQRSVRDKKITTSAYSRTFRKNINRTHNRLDPHRSNGQLYTHIKDSEMLSGILDDPEGTLIPEQRTRNTPHNIQDLDVNLYFNFFSTSITHNLN